MSAFRATAPVLRPLRLTVGVGKPPALARKPFLTADHLALFNAGPVLLKQISEQAQFLENRRATWIIDAFKTHPDHGERLKAHTAAIARLRAEGAVDRLALQDELEGTSHSLKAGPPRQTRSMMNISESDKFETFPHADVKLRAPLPSSTGSFMREYAMSFDGMLASLPDAEHNALIFLAGSEALYDHLETVAAKAANSNAFVIGVGEKFGENWAKEAAETIAGARRLVASRA